MPCFGHIAFLDTHHLWLAKPAHCFCIILACKILAHLKILYKATASVASTSLVATPIILWPCAYWGKFASGKRTSENRALGKRVSENCASGKCASENHASGNLMTSESVLLGFCRYSLCHQYSVVFVMENGCKIWLRNSKVLKLGKRASVHQIKINTA